MFVAPILRFEPYTVEGASNAPPKRYYSSIWKLVGKNYFQIGVLANQGFHCQLEII